MPGPTPKPVAERFWAKVDQNGPVMPGMTTPCWVWTGTKLPLGYGRLTVNRATVLAHRVAWELVNGPIPDGHLALHRCDNPPCVRAEQDPRLSHIFPGTHLDNMRDAAAKGRHKHQRRPELARGSSNGHAKVTESDVLAIRALHAKGGQTYRDLATRFHLSPAEIGFIVCRKHWRHVA